MGSNQSGTKLAVGKVLLSATLFGTAGTAIYFAPSEASVNALGLSRIFIGSIFLILILPYVGGNRSKLIQLIKHPLVWVMAICSAAYQPLFFGATERSGVAFGTLVVVGSIPIFTGLVGRIFLKEKLSFTWLLATAIAILGLVVRSWGEVELDNQTGLLMAIGAGLSVAFYLNAAKRELASGKYELELPAMAYLLGSFFLIPTLIGQNLSWLLNPSGFLVAIYLGIATMAVANSLQISGLKKLSPGPTATLTLADPLTATILGVLVLSEDFAFNDGIGVLLVAIALILQSRSK